MRVVIAPDSFKGTASAEEVAAAIAAGWLEVRPRDEVDVVPMADGGEGTIDAIEAASPGAVRRPVTVRGPDDRPVLATWLQMHDGTGVAELASTSGITLIDSPVPGTGHTTGFGEAVRAALDAGSTRLLLAIGGSCSTDGGAGVLAALGARILDRRGEPVRSGNDGLADAVEVDLRGLHPLPTGGVEVLTDVTAPLLGPAGASAVFGPQKGVIDVGGFDDRLRRFAALLPDTDPDAAGAGAAGGTGFGLLAWGARLVPGAPAVAQVVGLDRRIAAADLVVTGEGRFDAQSLIGKVPGHVLGAAGDRPVALIAGRITAGASAFAAAVSLSDLAGSPESAMRDPLVWLRRAGALLGRSTS